MKLEALKAKLEKLAARTTWNQDGDDFDPQDMSGGNFDDCYNAGQRDGETELAQEILEALKTLEP